MGNLVLARTDGNPESLIVDGNMHAEYYVGNGVLLEGVTTTNASYLTEGTLDPDRLPDVIGNSSTVFIGNGHGLSTLNGANITGNVSATLLSGSISQARLPSTIGNSQTIFVGNGALITGVSAASLANISNVLTGAISTVSTSNLQESRAVISNASGKLDVAANTSLQDIEFVSGLTGNVETRLQGLTAANIIIGAASTASTSNFTPSRVVLTNVQGKFDVGNATTQDLDNIRGLRSNVQQQLDTKAGNIILAPSSAVVTDADGILTSSATSANSLGYLEGVTSLIQSQLDSKVGRNVDSWLTSSDGTNRFRFSSADKTTFGTRNGYEWQGSSNTAIMTLNDAGNLEATGKVTSLNHVVTPGEENYNTGGGGGFQTRSNYLRFNYGRQWCISNQDVSSNTAGNLSTDYLYFKCGSGGGDAFKFALKPGGVEVTPGTAALPSYGFNSTVTGASTGMWSPAANTVAFSTTGVERLRINSTGDTSITGLLDFGDRLQNNLLTLWGNASSTATDFYGFGVNSSTLRYNTSSTTGRHAFYGDTTLYGNISSTGIASANLGTNALPAFTFTGDTNTGLWSPAADTIALSTGGVERLRIDSAGNVAIGSAMTASIANISSSVSTPLLYGNLSGATANVSGSITTPTVYSNLSGATANVSTSLTTPTVFANLSGSIANVSSSVSTPLLYGNISGSIANVSGSITTPTVFANLNGATANVSSSLTTPTVFANLSGSIANVSSSVSTPLLYGNISGSIANVSGSITTPTIYSNLSGATANVSTSVSTPRVFANLSGATANVSSSVSTPLLYGNLSGSIANVSGSITTPTIYSNLSGATANVSSSVSTPLLYGNLSGSIANVSGSITTPTIYSNLSGATANVSSSLTTPTIYGNIATALGSAALPTFTFASDLNTGMYSPGADTIAFSVAGSEEVRIDSQGNVGLGTTTCRAPLHVTSATSTSPHQLACQDLTNVADSLTMRAGLCLAGNNWTGQQTWSGGVANGLATTVGYSSSNNKDLYLRNLLGNVRLGTSGNDTHCIVTTAGVGIGTSEPTSTLHVVGTATVSDIAIGSGTLTNPTGTVVALSGSQVRIGTNAGATSQGTSAVAIGTTAGTTSQGLQAVAIGFSAGATSQGSQAVAIGGYAGTSNQGSNALAAGYSAGCIVQSPEGVALGFLAGSTCQGYAAVGIGSFAGFTNQGVSAVAIGVNAGRTYQTSAAVAIGLNAGYTSQLTQAIAVGLDAGRTSQAIGAIGIGSYAGSNTQDDYAVAVGAIAGRDSQGTSCVALGTSAGTTSQGVGAIGVGANAGGNTQGTYAVAVGHTAGRTSQGVSAVAMGYVAGSNLQGNHAVAIGGYAASNTQGGCAVAIGYAAGTASQGSSSLAAGYLAGSGVQGASCVALGAGAGYVYQSTAAVAIGLGAGGTSQGASGVAIGLNAGSNFQGANCVALGYNAGLSSQTAGSIAINASGLALNPNQAGLFVRPIRGTANTTPVLTYNASTYEVNYNSSTRRIKSNIMDIQSNTMHVYDLQPRQFNSLDGGGPFVGFVAEEAYEADPYFAWLNTDGKPEGLDQFAMLTFLIAEVKKLRQEVDALKATI